VITEGVQVGSMRKEWGWVVCGGKTCEVRWVGVCA